MPNDFHFVSFATLFLLSSCSPNKEFAQRNAFLGKIQEAMSDWENSHEAADTGTVIVADG